MKLVQQLDKIKGLGLHLIPPAGAKRFLKRMTVRAERRAAKTDPENAPAKRRYFKWYW